jgi:hypothetical protein
MKYLKKFNESKESDFYNDIEDCFIDFFDNDDAYLTRYGNNIILSFHAEQEPDDPKLSDLKVVYEKNLSIINDIENGFKRLKEFYPNFYYVFKFSDELYFELYENVEQGDFYKKSGDLIILDFDKIREILKLDKGVKISCNSSYNYLSIRFKDQEHYIKNVYRGNFPNTNDMLIFDINHHNLDSMRLSSEFNDLVIDGKKLIYRIEDVKIGNSVRSKYSFEIVLTLNKDLKIA